MQHAPAVAAAATPPAIHAKIEAPTMTMQPIVPPMMPTVMSSIVAKTANIPKREPVSTSKTHVSAELVDARVASTATVPCTAKRQREMK
jgi:hypothetical protein